MIITNKSSNAGSIRWTLPDGTTSKENIISWPTYDDPKIPNGTVIKIRFKLTAFSKRGNKSDEIVKDIWLTL